VELLYYVRALRRRWIVLAASVLLALIAAALVTARTSPQYAVSTTLIVSAPGDSGNTQSAYQALLLSQQRVKSYAALMRSRGVTAGVAKSLNNGLTAEDVQNRITAEAVPDTVLLRATVRDRSPALAMEIANTLGTEFSHYVDKLEQPPTAAHSVVKITVADDADLPTTPVSPRPIRNLGLGLVLGLIVGAIAAVLQEIMDTSVRSAQALREMTGSTTLGVIDFDRSAGRQPLTVRDDGHSARAETFRSLRTNLRFAGAGELPRSVAIAASVPEEGTTTIACNLAIALAEADWRVILVDTDLRRPRVADYLGIEATTGLTSVLTNGVAVKDVLRKWGPGSLSVLPSGPIPPNPSELLGSQKMLRTLGELEQKADIVIFDTPPLLAVTDAAVLARFCAGALLVTRFGRTRQEQVTQAVERLTMVDARLLGSVLNFAKPETGLPPTFGVPRLTAPADRRSLVVLGERT